MNAVLMGEKTKGHKRHIVTDTMGNLLAVVVHATNIHDIKAGIIEAKRAVEKYPSIQRFCADAGYHKTFEKNVAELLGLSVDVSKRITSEWQAPPKRLVVERTLAWMNNSRRLSKDYEISVLSTQAMCMISSFRVLIFHF